jgi:hypothetical protein
MRNIQHIKKFTFSGAFYNIIHAPHGITAVDKHQFLCFSFQHRLNHGFSEAAQICMGNLVRHFKIFRHFFQNRTFFSKALKQFCRGIFTDIMNHECFSSLFFSSISANA